MISAEHLSVFRDLILTTQRIVVIFPSQASYDVTAAAVTLTSGLEQLSKSIRVFSPQLPQWAVHGSEKISQELGNRNLRVSFPYEQEQVDKVSYSIDDELHLFHLVIQPKSGATPLDASQVTFAYNGAEADALILLGVNSLDALEQLYIGYEALYADTPLISINTYETEFGTMKLDISDVSSYSECVQMLCHTLEAPLTSEMATNLLGGIERETNHFQSSATTAETFESVAKLLHAGARRSHVSELSPSLHLSDTSSTHSFAHDSADRPTVQNAYKQSRPSLRTSVQSSSQARGILQQKKKQRPSLPDAHHIHQLGRA